MMHDSGGKSAAERALSLSNHNAISGVGPAQLPMLIVRAGDDAVRRFVEFFAATIRNRNTRAAYVQAVGQFFRWCEGRGLRLETIQPIAVAAYVEQLTHSRQAPTVKQHLAAIRMLFDWLVTGHVVTVNPAWSVRGPRHVVKKGKTPVLTAAEARQLLDSIESDRLIGLRDRALIALMCYSFARVSAAVAMNVEDYYQQGKRSWFRLHEKGGKFHEVPVHHNAEEYLDAYLAAAGIADDRKAALFRSAVGKVNGLGTNRRRIATNPVGGGGRNNLTIFPERLSPASRPGVHNRVTVKRARSINEEMFGDSPMRKPVLCEPLEGRLLMTTTPSDPDYGSEWGLSAVGASAAWDTTTGSSAVVVADIDTGLDYTHPDLYQNVWINPSEIPAAAKKVLTDTDGDGLITFRDLNAAENKGKVIDVDGNGRIDAADILTRAKYGGWADGVDEGKNGYVDDLIGWDFANNDRNPLDYDGHGTHTAGTIGATGDNGTGVSGVDWQVSLMGVKIFDDQGNSASDRAIAAAIRYSADNGARVSNNSWGGGGYSSAIYNAIAYAGTKGQLFVVAAGNDSANLDSRFYNDYPSEYALDNILVVGATTSGGSMAYYSNYGQTTVDVFAPGSNVLSTYLDGTYETMSGTSMATPHVAGAAGLMLAANGKLTAAQLKARIIAGADQSAGLAGASVAGGELNVANTVANAAGARYAGSSSSGLVIISRPGRWRRFSVPIPAPAPVQPPAGGSSPGTGRAASEGASTSTVTPAAPPAASEAVAVAATARPLLDDSTPTGLLASGSAAGSRVAASTAAAGRSVFSGRRVSATSAGYEPANVSRVVADGNLAARTLSASPAQANVPSSIDERAAIASAARVAWTPVGQGESLAADAASGMVPESATGEFSAAAEAVGIAGVAEAWLLTGLRTQLAALTGSLAVLVAGGYTYLRGRRVAARAGEAGPDGDEESGEPIEFTLRH